jgi:hypothetical protein
MVEMGMGEQDAVQPTQPDPAREQLALRALAAIHQEPAPPVQDKQRRQPPVDRGHAGGGSKENDLEQAAPRHVNDMRIIMTAPLPVRKGDGLKPGPCASRSHTRSRK